MTDTEDLSVRPVTGDDIAVLGRTLGNEYLCRDRLARQENQRGLLLMSSMVGEPYPVGLIYLWLEQPEEPELSARFPRGPLLMHLSVRNDMRNRGVGSYLVREAERALVQRGHTEVALGVEPHNRNAIRLYERLGYVDWGAGDIETTHIEFRARRKRSYRERCLVFVKDLQRQPPDWADACVQAGALAVPMAG